MEETGVHGIPNSAIMRSPWILPPNKKPNKASALALIILGFGTLMGGLFFDLYGIFHGMDMSLVFPVFILCMIIAPIILIVGAVMLARSIATEKYAQVARMQREYMAQGRHCPKCGRKIPEDSLICPYCGVRLA